jgi:hypothetical protein
VFKFKRGRLRQQQEGNKKAGGKKQQPLSNEIFLHKNSKMLV